jgi:hypothetical protein
MNEIIDFNPEISANKVKELWYQKQKISIQLVSELYKAKHYYSNPGYRSDLEPNESSFIRLNTFKQYLEYSGLYERKVYQWFERYIPEQNKLLTYEELQNKKQKDIENKKSEEQKKQESRIKQVREDDKEFEYNYNHKIDTNYPEKDKDDRWKRFKRTKDFIESEKERIKKIDENKIDSEKIFEDLNGYFKNQQKQLDERVKYNSKVKDLNTLYDVIEDYLTGVNNTQKLECYNNIIKYCRNKANELHRS